MEGMRCGLAPMLFLLSCCAGGQQIRPVDRPVERFRVHGASRLAALAKVGSLTNTSILVEADDLTFLQTPIDADFDRDTVREAIEHILGAEKTLTVRENGALLIVSTSRVKDRSMQETLGHFRFTGQRYSLFGPWLAETIRVASGCAPMGTAWAGPEMGVTIPSIDIYGATFEKIVARVADAPEATMWVVQDAGEASRMPSGSSSELGDGGVRLRSGICGLPVPYFNVFRTFFHERVACPERV